MSSKFAAVLVVVALILSGTAVSALALEDKDKHENHDHDKDKHGEHGEQGIDLGTKQAGAYSVKATQEGVVKAGGDAGFELKLTGGPKPKAVRAWVGVESAEGSVKAKPEVSDAGDAHLHLEVPDPMPTGSKLWVEIEPPSGARVKTSFDLKTDLKTK